MVEPIDALAFAIYNSPGVYAPLLGSGVSRAAKIPTGWEVVEDLVRTYAAQKGDDAGADPAAWYAARTGEEPGYSNLLAALAPGRADRQAILRKYFEPTSEEAAHGFKEPTKAHRAIARLVSLGYIKILLTTNFDRLLERAVEEEGVRPVVLAHSAAIEGALPLAHTHCTIVKLHGDYLDSRLRNTPQELSSYPRQQRKLLRQVLDEYGLIVCGWSGQWDAALSDALSAVKDRRFTTFWTVRTGDLSEEGQRLVSLRRAQVIDIASADEFWEEVCQRVEALHRFRRSHPMSREASIAELKWYLPRNESKIQLHDLLRLTTEAAYEAAFVNNPVLRERATAETLLERMKKYEAAVETLERLLLLGARWGDTSHDDLWLRAVERLGSPSPVSGGYTVWNKLQHYPAARLIYLAGIGALTAGRIRFIWRLFTEPRGPERRPVVVEANQFCIEDTLLKEALEVNYKIPGSEYLFDSLREPCREFYPDDARYEEAFVRFEYLLSLALTARDGWPWPGRFAYGNFFDQTVEAVSELLVKDFAEEPVNEAFLEGNTQIAREAAGKVREAASRFRYS